MKLVILTALITFSQVAFSQACLNTVPCGYRLNNGNNVRIDAWGKCRDVSNASGADHFIATKTETEWWSFITNTPTGLTDTICPIIPEYTSTAHNVMPTAAAGATVAGNGTAWNNSAWVQVTASTAAAIIITGVQIVPGTNSEFEIDVGKGGAGAETVVATIAGARNNNGGGSWWLQFPIPIDNIAAGQRVAVRFRKSGTNTNNWSFKVGYLNKPLSGGTVSTTTVASRVLPSAAAGVTLTPSGTAWTNSAWVQVTASTASALILGGIVVNPPAGGEWEVDVGVGGAGAESVITTFRDLSANGNGGPYLKLLKPALNNIGSGVRVAVRIRTDNTSTTAFTAKIIYYSSPTGLTLPSLPLKWAPSSAAGISVTPSGVAWTSSNWFEVITSAAANLQLASIAVKTPFASDYELDFGVGAAGSETTIMTWKAKPTSLNLVDWVTNIYPLSNNVPIGYRLAVRLRTPNALTGAWNVAVGYYEATTASNIASAYQKGLPAGAASLAVAVNTTAWANSAYVQFTAGITTDILLTSLSIDAGDTVEYEVDLATGAAGAETVLSTFAGVALNGGGQQLIVFPTAIRVAANTRVAIRMRKAAVDATGWNFALNYVDLQ